MTEWLQFVINRDDDKGLAIMSRHRYPVESCRVFERTTIEKLQASLVSSKEDDNDETVKVNGNGSNASNVGKEKQGTQKGGKSSTLKVVLGEALGYGPALSEHIILDAGLIPSTKVPKDKTWDNATIQALVQAVVKFEDWMQDIISGEVVPEGYILMQNRSLGNNSSISQPGNVSQVMFYFSLILAAL